MTKSLRMMNTLDEERAPLKYSDACNPVSTPSELAFSANDTIIPANNKINFSANTNDDFQHWLWIFNGAKPDTSNLKNPQNILYNKPGKYTVSLIATNANGNLKVTKINYIRVNPFGKNNEIDINYQFINNDSLKYYLNYNTLTIDFGNNYFSKIKVGIYNLIGQPVASYNLDAPYTSGTHNFNLPLTISNNIYIIRLTTQNGNIYKKLMVLH